MIASFADKRTGEIFRGETTARTQRMDVKLLRVVAKKLDLLDAAKRPTDLLAMPGNRLKTLGGDRRGSYSIRVNDQWRLVFEWHGEDARKVELVDYH